MRRAGRVPYLLLRRSDVHRAHRDRGGRAVAARRLLLRRRASGDSLARRARTERASLDRRAEPRGAGLGAKASALTMTIRLSWHQHSARMPLASKPCWHAVIDLALQGAMLGGLRIHF